MGNLFLRERERWWVWLMWGLLGGAVSAYVLSLSAQSLIGYLVPCIIATLLSVWMGYSKRFDFFRAFKILLLVATISCIPPLLNILLPFQELTPAIIKSAVILIVCTIFSLICAWFARRPKQYY